MHPQILYWKWNIKDLNTGILKNKIKDIYNRSVFNTVYVSLHDIPKERRLLSGTESVEAVRFACSEFLKYGIKMLLDIDIRVEKTGMENSEYYWLTYGSGKLDSEGNAQIYIGEGYNCVLRCWSVHFGFDGSFSDKINITGYTSIYGNSLLINAGSDKANKNVIFYISMKVPEAVDMCTDEALKETECLFKLVKDTGIAGACMDECHFETGNTKVRSSEYKTEIDDLDINKVDFFIDRINYCRSISIRYKEKYNMNLEDDLIYLWHIEKGNEWKSISVMNNYINCIRECVEKHESDFYFLTKKYLGKNAFCGVHPTWWGDELDFNMEVFANGLDWWHVKRDYSQTDEACPIYIRNSMARCCSENIWYNMWYSGRTLDIRTYFKETWTNARFGGRTHYLGYECDEPGVVMTMIENGRLEAVSSMEEKIAELNSIQKSRPDSRVLVVFGYESCTNPHISDPKVNRMNRRGKNMYKAFKITKELFEYPYLCEMIPSYEMEGERIDISNGKISYCGHAYDAVVVLYPDGTTEKTINILKQYDKIGKLMIIGKIIHKSNGVAVEHEMQEEFTNYYEDIENAKIIIKWLRKNNVKQNAGENFVVFEDGSITITSNGAKSTGNGVFCDEYDVNEPNADIVFIDRSGSKYII